MYKVIIYWSMLAVLFAACGSNQRAEPAALPREKGLINDLVAQDSLFKVINRLTGHKIDASRQGDSLEFLFLPVTASCPACRKKTIDSIVKFKNRLDNRHFVVVTGSGSRIINGYFQEQGYTLPEAPQIFYDTTGMSRILTSTNPNLYYAVNGKVYRKLSCTPATIKEDLAEFFGGL